MTPDEVRTVLQNTRVPIEEVLRSAARETDSLKPEILDLTNKAAEGVLLMPDQARLFFWGVHLLAGARDTALYGPLMRLLQRPEEELEWLFGDAITATLTRMVLSVFDGDPAPIIELIEDPEVDGFVRWGLLDALARLTFDNAIPRSTTLAVLDRLDREAMAGNGDALWMGWAGVIAVLGLEERADRVRASWQDGRNPESQVEQQDWEERLAEALANPDDPGRFHELGMHPIDDPVEALRWMNPLTEMVDVDRDEDGGEEAESDEHPLASGTPWVAADEQEEEDEDEDEEQGEEWPDPAAEVALDAEELEWLDLLLSSERVPPGAMSVEELDGFFTALLAGRELVLPGEYLPVVWSDRSDQQQPAFDSTEQAAYTHELLARHWQTISLRLHAGYPHPPLLDRPSEEVPGCRWAQAFIRGIGLRVEAWAPLMKHKRGGLLLATITSMAIEDHSDLRPEQRWTEEQREEMVEVLPEITAAIYRFWRNRELHHADAVGERKRKIGRNEPCPCGSGRKFKLCCGRA